MFSYKALFFLCAQCATTKAIHNSNNHNSFSLESINFYHDNEKSMQINEKAPISLFFHGGDLVETLAAEDATTQQEESTFVAMAECAFVPRSAADIELELEMEYDEDEDDEDDDQDDGSSSMLSNSSIRRKVAVAIGGDHSESCTEKTQTGSSHSSTGSHGPSSSTMIHNLRSKTTLPHDPLLLNIRGGAQMSDEFAKRLVTAAMVTLMYEGCIGHIFEFLKISMQTAEPGTTYMDIITSITSNKGIGGLWDGFVPWGVIQSIFKGGVFGLAHAIAKSHLAPLAEKGIMPELMALTLAGGIAGGFQGYILSPTLLLKTRVMTNPVFRERMTLLRTTMLSFAIGYEVVKNEGVGALMKGSNIFALKRVFDWSTRFFFSDMFESMMLQYGCGLNGVLSPKEKIIASILGGTASTIVTLPLDVIVAKSQDAKKAGVKVSAWETFAQDYKVGGFKQLYDANMQGFEARLVHVCMTTVVMKTGSGLMYNFLFGDKN